MLFVVNVFQSFWQLLEENVWERREWVTEPTVMICCVFYVFLIVCWSCEVMLIGAAIAVRLIFRKPRMCTWSVCGLAVVFVFLDRGLFLRALTEIDKTWNCHKIIPQWVNMSVICTGDFIFWRSDVFLEFASIPFQFISSHKSEPCIPFPASLTLHFRLFWPLSLSRLFS